MIISSIQFVTIMIATFTLGFIISAQLHQKNSYLRLYMVIYILYYLSRFLNVIPDFLPPSGDSFRREKLLCEILNNIFDISFYTVLLLFMHYLFGIITRIKITIFYILYVLTWIISRFEPGVDLETGRIPLLIQNLTVLPFLLYIIVISLISRHGIQTKKARNLFYLTLVILSSSALVVFVDGMLEVFLSINIPKEPIIIIIFSLLSLVYLIYFSDYLRSNELQVSESFIIKFQISKRESEIIGLLLNGYSYLQIAEELFISIATVKTHVHNIYVKTKVRGRFSLMNALQNVN